MLLALDSTLINLINDAKQTNAIVSTNCLFLNNQFDLCAQIKEKEIFICLDNPFKHDITSKESFVICAMMDGALIDNDLISIDFLDQSKIIIEMHPDKNFINFKRIIK